MTLYHQRYRKCITRDNAKAWATWLARRYKDVPNIVWSMTPEAKQEFVPVLRELAAGLREGEGGAHLITFKPDPAPYSSSFIHDESWLDFNSMQTWNGVKLIYPMVTEWGSFANTGVQSFTTPEGWPDAVLTLQAAP